MRVFDPSYAASPAPLGRCRVAGSDASAVVRFAVTVERRSRRGARAVEGALAS